VTTKGWPGVATGNRKVNWSPSAQVIFRLEVVGPGTVSGVTEYTPFPDPHLGEARHSTLYTKLAAEARTQRRESKNNI